MSKKVAIIGAGASGLTAIKCCLDEGLEPVCYERTEHMGGLWYYTEDVLTDQACVSKSTVINSSKEMTCFSDFPMPKEFPIFLHNTYVMKYFNMYADQFGLRQHINFLTEVLHVSKTDNFDQTGKWQIDIRNKSGKTKTKIFDGVLVCTGHHAEKNMPDFPGMKTFDGKILHSHDYKDTKGYEDKRVVVVGIGNSGGDAATELSRAASQVFLSTRRGTWVFNRIADDGLPFDMLVVTRFTANVINKLFPWWYRSWRIRKKLRQRINHDLYSLAPKHEIFAQPPLLNDDLPSRIACGSIKILSDIKQITKTGVEFVAGSFEDNIDVILLATGYIFGFPFIDKSIIDVRENKAALFKYMFPPDLEKHTLAVIGCVQPLGSTIPVSEMQCRLACRIIKGDAKLPSRQEMWSDIRMKEYLMSSRYVKSKRHTIQVDWVPFMDELAELNGCKPAIISLFLTDPKLAFAVLFCPCSPYQYRLRGPGKWEGARDAILTQWSRTLFPLRTRPMEVAHQTSYIKSIFYVIMVAVFSFLVKLFFLY